MFISGAETGYSLLSLSCESWRSPWSINPEPMWSWLAHHDSRDQTRVMRIGCKGQLWLKRSFLSHFITWWWPVFISMAIGCLHVPPELPDPVSLSEFLAVSRPHPFHKMPSYIWHPRIYLMAHPCCLFHEDSVTACLHFLLFMLCLPIFSLSISPTLVSCFPSD